MAELIQVLESGLHPDSESPSRGAPTAASKGLLAIMTVLTAAGGLRNGFDQGTANMAHAAMMIGVLLVSLVIALLLLRRTPAAPRQLPTGRLLLFGQRHVSALRPDLRLHAGMELGRYASLEMLGLAALLPSIFPGQSEVSLAGGPLLRWLCGYVFLPQLSVLPHHHLSGARCGRCLLPNHRAVPARRTCRCQVPGTPRPTAQT